MPGVLYDANNVVVGHAVLYTKPWSPTVPVTKMPVDTALFDPTDWETAGWTVAGATNEGFKVNAEASTTTVTIEEQSTPVGESLEAKSMSIEAALAEDTLQSIDWAWGGGTKTVVAPAAGVEGHTLMTLSDEIKYVAATLEMKNFKGMARRIFIPKMSLFGSGETSFRRAAEKRLYPVRLNSLCKPTDIEVEEHLVAAI